MGIDVKFYQHPDTRQPMVAGSVVAGLAGIDTQALADVIGEWLYGSEFARRYWGEFAVLAEPDELGMTLDGLRVLTGHLEPQFPGCGRRLDGLRMALAGEAA